MGDISFVYIHFALAGFVLLLWLLFFSGVVLFIDRDYIARHHPTISSYCSDPAKFGNRFLVATTCTMGGLLACILVEEYNSRDDSDPRFWPELVACGLLLPFIGICHSNGHAQITHYDIGCGSRNPPVCWSTGAHVLFTIGFFGISMLMNLWYSIDIVDSTAGVVFLIFSIIDIILFVVFFMILKLLPLLCSGGPPCPCSSTCSSLGSWISSLYDIDNLRDWFCWCCPQEPKTCEGCSTSKQMRPLGGTSPEPSGSARQAKYRLVIDSFGTSRERGKTWAVCEHCAGDYAPNEDTEPRKVVNLITFGMEIVIVILTIVLIMFTSMKRNNNVGWFP